MNRDVTTRLMTIEEAQRLSELSTSYEADKERRRLWAWQNVQAAMARTVDDETIEKMASLRLPR